MDDVTDDPTELVRTFQDLNAFERSANQNLVCAERTRYTKKHHKLTTAELKTGFGLHTVSSLELAIKKAQKPKHVCLCSPCADDDGGEELHSLRSQANIEITTEAQTPVYVGYMAQKELRYLMGLGEDQEEEAVSGYASEKEEKEKEEEENLINGSSEAMRRAQRYLREHKIFEFFQFLIAHLLAETPFDPIDFLINLLDKCLIYRSGICDPPLLYQKKHIECLFNLMDRMRTGFVELDKYKTGMMTLGLKSYNPSPPMTRDGLVTQLFFVEEGHNCLKDLLNDMIRKRSKETPRKRKEPKAPPPSAVRSACPFDSNADDNM